MLGTKIVRLKLVNFKGIKSGLGQNELNIDFTKTDRRYILLLGGNGTGKTTILSTLHPFSETFDKRKEFIIEGTIGRKEIDISKDDMFLYKIVHHYQLGKNKSTIEKVDLLDPKKKSVELNPAGTTRQFAKIVEDELGINTDLFKLIKIGSQTANFIDLNSSERKTYIGKFTPDISEYLDSYKIATKKVTDSAREVKFIGDELNKIDSIEVLSSKIEASSVIEKQLVKQSIKLSLKLKKLEKKSSKSAEMLEKAQAIASERNAVKTGLAEIENDIDEILVGNPELKNIDVDSELEILETKKLVENRATDMELRLSEAKLVQSISQDENLLIKDSKQLESFIESTKDLEEYSNQLEELNIKFNKISKIPFEDFEDYSNKFFKKVSNEVLLNITNFINNLNNYVSQKKPSTFSSIILEYNGVEEVILFEKFLTKKLDKVKLKLPELEESVAKSKSKLELILREKSISEGTVELLNLCSKGKSCCLYKKVTELTDKDSDSIISKLKKEVSSSEEKLLSTNGQISEYEDALEYIEAVRSSLSDLSKDEKAFIIKELKSSGSVLDRIVFSNSNDLDSLTTKVDSLQAKLLMLNKINVVFTNINRVNALIDKYSNNGESEKKRLNKNIQELNKTISKNKQKLSKLEEEIKSNESSFNELNSVIVLYKNLSHVRHLHKLKSEELVKATDKMRQIKEKYVEASSLISSIEEIQEKLDNEVNVELEDIKKEIDSLRVSKARVEDYTSRRLKLEETRELYNVVKDAVDVKSGMPLILVGNYLQSIKDRCNELLYIAYSGKFYIDFEISDKDFSIAIYNNGVKTANDILETSQGEVSLVKISLSLAIVIEAIKKSDKSYNIIYLDEIDAQLDSSFRMAFLDILEKQLLELGTKQCFVITHNNCFFDNSAGLILLPKHIAELDNLDFMSNKDIIADLTI